MKKNYWIQKNLIDNKELEVLSTWIDNNKNKFMDAGMGGNRLTSRFSSDLIYPPEAYEIQERICEKLIKDEVAHNFILPAYEMAASIASVGDFCYLHKDPMYYKKHKTLHCNIFLSDFKGGEPYIQKTPTEEDVLKVGKGDTLCYFVSEIYHGSKKVIEGKRKMWVFGYCLNV